MNRTFQTLAATLALSVHAASAQTYAPPAPGDFGGMGALGVYVDRFANPSYPSANGQPLNVSVYHPDATLNPARPTIFFAHGFTNPVGDAMDYSSLLSQLASKGYNVVFSPYEGGTNPSITTRFDELTTGFEAAVTRFGLNTTMVGFAGHSYGAGFLPAVVEHEMMGKASQFKSGNTWGSTAAFMYSMAPGYAYGGGGQTGVAGALGIAFPAQLNVVIEVFNDDTTIADPRLAIDVFYNISTPAGQKDFLTVYGDAHGSPVQTASHFLPNSSGTSTSLQAWGIFRHLDALASYTFTGDLSARTIALGSGAAEQIDQGRWSDGVPVVPLGATDLPSPDAYSAGPYLAQFTDPANPRGRFALAPEPSTLLVLCAGVGSLLQGRRRRRPETGRVEHPCAECRPVP